MNAHVQASATDESGRAVRVAVGAGAPPREREIIAALEAGSELTAERCLSADQLLECVRSGRAGAAVVSTALHRFEDGVVHALGELRVPFVLLAAPEDVTRWRGTPVEVLPLDAEPSAIRAALLALGVKPRDEADRHRTGSNGGGPAAVAVRRPPDAEQLPDGQDEHAAAGTPTGSPEPSIEVPSVIAVAGGHGSPGRTTLAVGLAAALGAVAPTILVDADTTAPGVAAAIDANPTRNISMLAHAGPQGAGAWDRAIHDEIQPIGPRSPEGWVLCGLPKPEMRGGVAGAFFEQLIAELRGRYRFVVLDVGAELLGGGGTLHRLALSSADLVLVVAAADMIGLLHARRALATMRAHVRVPQERLGLVVNRHHGRYHHGRTEVEWALEVPAAAVVPHDFDGVQRALAAQLPVVLAGRSRAGGAILDLAERICRGRIVLPAPDESARQGPAAWLVARLKAALAAATPGVRWSSTGSRQSAAGDVRDAAAPTSRGVPEPRSAGLAAAVADTGTEEGARSDRSAVAA